MQEWSVSETWLDAACELAEGPFYEKSTDSLRFIDIKKKQVRWVRNVSSAAARMQVDATAVETLQLDIAPGVTADIKGVDPTQKILVGLKHGLAILDVKTGKYEMVKTFEDGEANERLRANDGAADPHGHFWLGTMTDFGFGPFQPEGLSFVYMMLLPQLTFLGSLYRFTEDGTRVTEIKGVTIPNGIGFSPDLKTMYFTHSPTREVFAYDYDSATSAISNKRIFYKHDGTAEPDGLRVDIEGNVWQAFYGEAMVLRINPEGKVIGKVSLPTRNITCVQFVGEDLIITSAADKTFSRSARLGGCLFRVHVGVKGMDLFKYALHQ